MFHPNYYYPATYQPMQMIQQTPQQTNNTPGIIWVQGEAGAKAYPVGAGNSVLLMDTEDAILYIKSVDQSGIPQPLRVFELCEKHTQNNAVNASAKNTENVSRDEFERLKSDVTRLYRRVMDNAEEEGEG